MDSSSLKLTDFQCKLHGITREKNQFIYSDSSTNSLFSPVDETNCHYDPIFEVMPASIDVAKLKVPIESQLVDIEVSRITVTANPLYTNFAAMHIGIEIPKLEVLEEHRGTVEICLTQNPVDNCWRKIDEYWGSKFRDSIDNRV